MSGALLFCPREMFNEGRQDERQEDIDRKEQQKVDAIIQAEFVLLGTIFDADIMF